MTNSHRRTGLNASQDSSVIDDMFDLKIRTGSTAGRGKSRDKAKKKMTSSGKSKQRKQGSGQEFVSKHGRKASMYNTQLNRTGQDLIPSKQTSVPLPMHPGTTSHLKASGNTQPLLKEAGNQRNQNLAKYQTETEKQSWWLGQKHPDQSMNQDNKTRSYVNTDSDMVTPAPISAD